MTIKRIYLIKYKFQENHLYHQHSQLITTILIIINYCNFRITQHLKKNIIMKNRMLRLENKSTF